MNSKFFLPKILLKYSKHDWKKIEMIHMSLKFKKSFSRIKAKNKNIYRLNLFKFNP